MYIHNLSATSIPAFQCGAYLANYLIRNGVPILSKKDSVYYFADTENLRKVLNNAPLLTKLLEKMNNGFCM